MKKLLLINSLALGLSLSLSAHALPSTDEIKEEALEIWDNTKIITTEIGIMSGQTLKNMGEALEKYSQENKDKIDRELEKTSQKNENNE